MMASQSSRLILSLATMALGGCTSMAGLGGSSGYACKAPAGVQCASVSGTYANAMRGNLPGQQRSAGGAEVPEEASTSARPVTKAEPDVSASALRSPPRILRLWIKPYEDADSDLIGEQHVYVRIDNGRWLVDHNPRPARDAGVTIRQPLQAKDGSGEVSSPVSTPLPFPQLPASAGGKN
ncbi:TraV family lipoprotein [Actimicrobium sp. CCI2.3]|uniref:TraV family lipoprotein n=1 Tax=Actimicrobium sp. CCI2.3 TaxID=3048616 RepID=UPI002AB54320|nr:TraV family lipoprotein [Actimicrobium sp. CCI2.3]MDY7574441.1 TraV family lipoprotein [Actimicrobium sp. CCI2.3]MEB0022481.1 TraV family lipoprotein [Actimicrobium sp. CCI2.3]